MEIAKEHFKILRACTWQCWVHGVNQTKAFTTHQQGQRFTIQPCSNIVKNCCLYINPRQQQQQQ